MGLYELYDRFLKKSAAIIQAAKIGKSNAFP